MYRKLGVHVVIVAYRGYSLSTGTPTEAGLRVDGVAICEHVMELLPDSPLFIFGRSLGGAVAIHTADAMRIKQKPLAGLIIENTFLSVPMVVDHHTYCL